MQFGETVRFAQGVMRAVKRGNLFPAAARRPFVAAPGGSRPAAKPPSASTEIGWFGVSEHVFPIAGLTEPIRVLHLTDVHLRRLDEWTVRLAERVSRIECDLVAITGDVLMRGWKNDAADVFLSNLPPARLGRYAVMGNWEYWSGAPAEFWSEVLARHGVQLLHDRSVDLGALQLVGTDDWLAGRPDLRRAFAHVDPTRPTMALSHSPIVLPEIARPGLALVLSGHSHAGQVRIPGLGAVFLPKGCGKYVYGWYQSGPTWMYVGAGIGWSVAPIRWRAPPELAMIQLVPG